MKILVVGNNSDGLYRFRKDLLLELVLKNNDVYVVTPFDECIHELKTLGINLIELKIDRRGTNFLREVVLLFKYYKILRNIKPDLVITYTIKPNIYCGWLCSLLRIKYVCNITGLGTTFQKDNMLKRIVMVLYKIALRKVKVVFFENKENFDIFVNKRIINKENGALLHGAGVNTEEFEFVKYPIQKDNIKFLFIGRIMKEKGIEEFMYVAKKIKKENSNIQFDIVGPMEDDYVNIINEFQEKKIINYYGFQKDVRPFIESCHCFVLPSYHEGMANTLLEAGAMGRPLITSNIYGCKEAINNNGYVVNVRDRDDLYRKIKKFIALSYDEKKQMGIRSRNHISQVFDKKKVVQETIKGLNLWMNIK